MDKQIITFSANQQHLHKTGGLDIFATKTVSYIEAHFDLGDNWDGYDSIEAVWWNDRTRPIRAVLDTEGICIVPPEVLTKKGEVYVNLVGVISSGNTLTDRLTTHPITALTNKFNAQLGEGTTTPLTPSEYEQFVASVKADADRAEAGATASAQSAQSASESATASANSATSSEQSATASAESAQNASESAQSAETAKDDAESARDEILGMRATAETLEAGSDATASYSDGLLTLGIPRGDKGVKGDTGETGATPNISIGTVETLEPTEDATASITGTVENPVLNFGIPKGDTGEVSLEDLEALLPTETASGSIVTITDGQAIVPAKSLKVALEPIQSGSGTPSPDNVRPISGRTEVVTWDDPKYGGTVAWNQLLTNVQPTRTINGVTFTNNEDGTYTVNGTATADATFALSGGSDKPAHKVLLCGCPAGGSPSSYILWDGYAGWFDSGNGTVKLFANSGNWGILITVKSGITVDNIVFKPQLFDLTQMFGSTIADYIYSLEQANAGAGVAYFRNLFPNDYYEYNAGETTCVSAVNGDPYNHYTTPLGQTVYGGVLDVVSGELVVDKAMVDLGTLEWSYATDRVPRFGATFSQNANYKSLTVTLNGVSSAYSIVPFDTLYDPSKSVNGTMAAFSTTRMAVRNDGYSDAASFKTAMSGVQLCYELATPTTIQLTPTEVKLLLGNNTVWSDGDVAIVYSADVTKWIEKQLS